MKKINKKSSNPETRNSKVNDSSIPSKGTTKTLLEKYKPKGYYNIEIMRKGKEKKDVD